MSSKTYHARLQILIVVLMKIGVFQDVMPCRLVNSYLMLLNICLYNILEDWSLQVLCLIETHFCVLNICWQFFSKYTAAIHIYFHKF